MIEGPDAGAFAHAQFSSKVISLEAGCWQFSAWLNPQGRVRAFFHLSRVADDKYLLLLRGGTASAMADALQPYVFRSKVSISAQLPRSLSTGAALPTHAVLEEDGVMCLGCGNYSMQLTERIVDDEAWLAPQLRMGWPWLPDSALDELLPAALSLQRLQAVAVDKGCYPGQEIVARLHFRGGNKRHLCSGTLSQPVNPGESLRMGGNDVGRVLDVVRNSANHEALLALNDDVAAQAKDGWLDIFDDKNVKLYVATRWPA
ncbi:MAG: folate-binding protein [Pseudomonadota bacterium]|nr:folate-binding protein [Pseudomonadota bacterium]